MRAKKIYIMILISALSVSLLRSRAVATPNKIAKQQSCEDTLASFGKVSLQEYFAQFATVINDAQLRSIERFFYLTGESSLPEDKQVRFLVTKSLEKGNPPQILLHKIKAYSEVSNVLRVVRSSGQHLEVLRKFLYDPLLEPSLYAIGRSLSLSKHFHIADEILRAVGRMLPILQMDLDTNGIVDDLTAKINSEVIQSYKDVEGKVGQASIPRLSLGDFSSYLQNLIGLQPEYLDMASKYFGDEYCKKSLALFLQAYRSERSLEILDFLFTQNWFLSQSLFAQLNTAFTLLYTAHKASDADSSDQKVLLNNTLDRIIEMNIPVLSEDLGNDIGGLAYGDEKIEVNDHGKELSVFEGRQHTLKYAALNVIPHEVHHILSKRFGFRRRNDGLTRFLEESRAYQVGSLGLKGRLFDRKELATKALYLLGFHNRTNYYLYIKKDWEASPSRYFNYLKLIGFDDPAVLVGSIENADFLVEQFLNTAGDQTIEFHEAWNGWNGFLFNDIVQD